MNKLNIILLYGGESGEHIVSTISAYSIYKHINRDKFNINIIGITKSGKWFFQSKIKTDNNRLLIIENKKDLISIIPGEGLYLNSKKLSIDFVFPVLHGTYGEDGTVQGLLELLHLPYAGSSVIGSAVGMDKIIAKRVWESCNIPVVPFVEIYRTENKNYDTEISELESKINYPMFVKPVNAGSSVGASKAKNRTDLIKAIKLAFEYDTRIMVELCINTREIECAVIGNNEVIGFKPGEVISNHEFYDFDAKYNDSNGAELTTEAILTEKESKTIIEYAKTAYSAIMAEGFARVDFFIDKNSGTIYINEINTIPGFTNISMFPKMCEAGGISYPNLIEKIIQLGISRDHAKCETRKHL